MTRLVCLSLSLSLCLSLSHVCDYGDFLLTKRYTSKKMHDRAVRIIYKLDWYETTDKVPVHTNWSCCMI